MSSTKYDVCALKTDAILQGTLSLGDINNATIWERGYIHTGPIRGLDQSYPRTNISAITYNGCLAICGGGLGASDPVSVLSTWIFPLTIFLNLPYDSLHFRKFRGTASAVLNWLGCPQAALTATIQNFLQTKSAVDLVKTTDIHRVGPRWTDALFVLTCLNQFKTVTAMDYDATNRFLHLLLYGLFRPATRYSLETELEETEQRLIRELLAELAFQLRLTRRRGVIPVYLTTVAFLLALAVSSTAPSGGSGVDPLLPGLLFTWGPVLILLTLVDRNPISSDRHRVLFERWLHNVSAIYHWRTVGRGPVSSIQWWREPASFDERHDFLYIGEFIGQGRTVGDAGLASAVMAEIRARRVVGRSVPLEQYRDLASAVKVRLCRRSWQWLCTSLAAELAVVVGPLMAFMLAFNNPTVGFGCDSGSILLWAVLSTLPWLLTLFRRNPRGHWKVLYYVLAFLAMSWLIAYMLFRLIGVMDTCFCLSSYLGYPWSGGYVTFVSEDIIREYFNGRVFRVIASVVGFSIPVTAVVTTWWVRKKCQFLWRAAEGGYSGRSSTREMVDTGWLAR
ncbi:hypothetical protein QBC34DRAFT_357047 [Podospora aff. communis PSN243]|uniref:Uncharacterized protein n=1 Tax=Podospora aff. communis PSN243 TaxID=3040156 RepID=A0AAV9GFE2_9PEZI|nr:hypothetical protein QBC34DRAFT_357047 [Podospora aff. communis PSN243]